MLKYRILVQGENSQLINIDSEPSMKHEGALTFWTGYNTALNYIQNQLYVCYLASHVDYIKTDIINIDEYNG